MNKYDILRFYISMKNLIFMHQWNRIKQISNNKRSCLLWKSLPSWNNIEKLSIWAKFHNNVEVILITETSINFDDIWMVKEALNFELTNKLNQEVVVHYSLLLYHFQTHDHSSP